MRHCIMSIIKESMQLKVQHATDGEQRIDHFGILLKHNSNLAFGWMVSPHHA
jgi:hypothetical protein